MLHFTKLIDTKNAIYIFVLGLVSGAISFLFLSFINLMMGVILAKENPANFNYIIYFCVLLWCFVWSRRALSYIIIKFSQQVFWQLRSEVLRIILAANFYQISVHKDKIYASLIQDVRTLTDFSLSIINFLSALVMTIGCFVYMGMQSVTLLLMTIGVSLLGVVVYWIGVHFNNKRLKHSRELEDGFMKNLLDILDGFREIHMNPAIGHDIYNQKIQKISNESYTNNTNAFASFLNVQIIGEVLFYSLIASVLFFSSYLIKESPESIVKYIFILLYLLGGINSLMLIIPQILNVRISSGKINQLREELHNETFDNHKETSQLSIDEFNELTISDLSFQYTENDESKENNSGFSVGPINFSLTKGEIIFIYGGNGSGKTTMINVLLGTLKGHSGITKYNDIILDSNNYKNYRALFSVVFSDFYLFDELYGFDTIDKDQIEEYLELFELKDKVTFDNLSFSSNKLSTGQRKRLALIVALIRSKPILVLDEWAADQDPFFRKKFYTEIIPLLKDKGFSIIAITHDDSYYHIADKLYKMENGQLSLNVTSALKKEMVR
ncbi:cyclic peptide export ABC transporter [Flavobacterium lipolyticum]|uniref:Cyclic peptide export ABC transporter n=1 Tax=Flavobacterium lipolyticum TaxID=2893754 RepID=A0ABS8M3X7_9FLAO|nr:cyclic peptide export ABC transporter [Flavobacterium sp. F-126]MCC9019524.1 cyclic peptide export ABC transporter [Flavobacterium sp. F-126]